MTDKRKDCPMRHENGNCTVAGGFCTAVNDPICEALHNAFDCGYRSALRQHGVTDKDVGKSEPLTNAQKIRAMTDEELVKLHYSCSAHCIADDPTVCDRHDFIGNLTPCEQCYLKWLQQPAEDDDHDERKENENV